MFVCMNSESMLGEEVKNSADMLTIILPGFASQNSILILEFQRFSGQEFWWNSSWSCPEYQQYAGNNSSGIPVKCRQ